MDNTGQFKYPFDSLIENWVEEKKIPAAVLDVSVGNRFRFQKAYGSWGNSQGKHAASLDTLFDLASLTKVAVTLPAALVLISEGKLQLEDKVTMHLPRFRHREVTIRHLLMHASGLPDDLGPRPWSAVGRDVIGEAYGEELLFTPGSRTLYSDLGMILLAEIISRLSGEPLDRLARRLVFDPLGMETARFRPEGAWKERAAATEMVEGQFISGEVHDEKTHQMGGVSGSAGLFSAAEDMYKYAKYWLNPEQGRLAIAPELLKECVAHPLQTRGIGWEMWNGTDPVSCGQYFSPGSFGHNGSTGTSLWIDPERELTVVFLTNIVHNGQSGLLRTVRPMLHDAVYTSLFGGKC
ncbi:serine hydrolase domain-containing protein [Paenibacillus sp. GCM10027626]|uniref:serine hydrolase domain-containing protein n=1 Tax=Paenibacillus sp. GCM10027626 TaxID=3273411 RepID=UPI0036272DA0